MMTNTEIQRIIDSAVLQTNQAFERVEKRIEVLEKRLEALEGKKPVGRPKKAA